MKINNKQLENNSQNTNKSYDVFEIDAKYENSLSSSPQLQYQKQSKLLDNDSNSLPIPWIAAIIINAILVFLFVLFVIYCYCRSKKKRQRIRNPDKDSLFSSKSSKHSVQEVQNVEKNVIHSSNDATKDNTIFDIESEHKRLTDEVEVIEDPTVDSSGETRKTSIKSPMTKVRVVTRMSSGARSSSHEMSANGTHYNPTDSPSVSQFTDQLNDSVPNQSQYKSKHEDYEIEALEPLTEVEDDYQMNGNSRQSPKSPKRNISSPSRQMPSSPSRIMSPSIPMATSIMTRAKGLGQSPNRKVKTPGSSHSSHDTAVQTSPNNSWANIPGAIVGDEKLFDERTISLRAESDRKYFLYIIKDVNPFTKKECVGRISLPARQRMTLEQLRNYLLQSDDQNVRNLAKRKFKFLSESYRLVVMNESFTPVDQVYQTQGIFIKFSAADSVPFGYRSQNRIRAANRLSNKAIENNTNYDNNSNSQLDSVTRSTRHLSHKTDSIYGSTPRSTYRKDSIYGSNYGTNYTKSTTKSSIYGSTLKSTEKSRFGYEKTPNRRKESNVTFDRTPRRRDESEYTTASPLSMTGPAQVSPMLSPRTRVRLCRKIQLQAQVERGQLEEMPNFFTSSLESVCDNAGCTNKPLLRCLVCTKVNYCSPHCKKEHWNSGHRFVCKKPPWKG